MKSGRVLGVPDAIIAATAISNNLTLVTLNPNDFRNVAGLSTHAVDDGPAHKNPFIHQAFAQSSWPAANRGIRLDLCSNLGQ